MKSIIIAAGYATRLYPLTKNFPKPLLEIGNNTIIGRILDDIDSINDIDEHIIVTNHKFYDIFKQWLETKKYKKNIRIINDGTTCNEKRLGAVKDLQLAIEKENITDDILVLAADNVLDFSFKGFVDFFKEKESSCIMYHYEPSIEKLQRTGVIQIDSKSKVLEMQEKPEFPKTNLAVPPFYIYAKKDLHLINKSILLCNNIDAPGNLANFMTKKTEVYAWEMTAGRYDIGSIDSYNYAKNKFKNY